MIRISPELERMTGDYWSLLEVTQLLANYFELPVQRWQTSDDFLR